MVQWGEHHRQRNVNWYENKSMKSWMALFIALDMNMYVYPVQPRPVYKECQQHVKKEKKKKGKPAFCRTSVGSIYKDIPT